MQRVVEPEIMDDPEQVEAYDAADFSGSHDRRVDVFRELAPPAALRGRFLDLGCGSGDLDFRFLKAFPECEILGVDGSPEMIRLGVEAARLQPEWHGRISFLQAFIPSNSLPQERYSTVMSNSFLHHLHDSQVLWETVKRVASPDSFIFVSDLRRPESEAEVKRIVETLAGGERAILKRDFYNSLCAAFEVCEVEAQLSLAGIKGLTVRALDEIHLLAYGFIERV